MSGHSFHPDSHVHGLSDDCPRCAEHAEHPLASLDNTSLQRLVRVALDPTRLDGRYGETELVAAANVLTALEHTGRLFEVAPGEVSHYLREKWRVAL